VLYNPTDEIFENIDSYVSFIDTLIVIDNSESIDQKIKHELYSRYNNLVYIGSNENFGIATALNIACDKGIELGFEWILTMDQDSKFINFSDYIKCLLKLENKEETAILGSNTMWHAADHLPSNPTCNHIEKFLVITSGNFLNLKLFNDIGRFEDKLFIDMVDHDYCMKAQQKNYKIYFYKDILVEHSLGMLFQRKNIFTGKIRNKIEHSPQRAYYITRNSFYLYKKYSKEFPEEFNLLKTLNILFIHEITKILIYEDQKIKKIKAKLIGLYHALSDRYGKYLLS